MSELINELIDLNEQSLRSLGMDERVAHLQDGAIAYAHMATLLWEQGSANNGQSLLAAWAIYRTCLDGLKKQLDKEK